MMTEEALRSMATTAEGKSVSFNMPKISKSKLNIQLDAINSYIDELNKCDEEGTDIKEAYKIIVNKLRVKAGIEPLKYGEVSERLKKFVGIANK